MSKCLSFVAPGSCGFARIENEPRESVVFSNFSKKPIWWDRPENVLL